MKRPRFLVLVGVSLLLAASCEGNTEKDSDASLSEGDLAPSFTLPSASGGKVAMSDFAAKKPVLLYFSMGPG